jgi:hypothetical protein
MRRADRKSGGRKQRSGPRLQVRLGGEATQGDEADPQVRNGETWKGHRADLCVLDEIYQGQLDNVFTAWENAKLIPQKAKPPTGCTWQVEKDAASVTLSAIDKDGEAVYRVDGQYCDPNTGMWRDPREVSERLAQVILYGRVLENTTSFKGTAK